MVNDSQVLNALKSVMDPDLKQDIVSLGFVKNLAIHEGKVSFDVELTTPACPVKDRLREESRAQVMALPGVTDVAVRMTAQVRGGGSTGPSPLSSVKNMVAIASGKGGVGKSTASVNIAYALAATGASVGLMDADVYGPSVPTMIGASVYPQMTADQRILPIEHRGIKVMSMGFLATDETPIIWRGPMATKLIQQFLGGVQWGPLDYLIIDLPPGTGDVQLTLTQAAPLTGAVIVTTPQDVALGIAQKGLKMFEKVNVPILGVIQNMSGFACSHCGQTTQIFRTGGGHKLSERFSVPFLGEVPLDPEVVEGGDSGMPIVLKNPHSPAARAYREIAGKLAAQISIVTMHTANVTVSPKETKVMGAQRLEIIWSDDHASVYTHRTLRAACPCAGCIDEWTGAKRVSMDDIPADINPTSIRPVGRYALNILWSDGHGSGIYPYAMLRGLCECDACRSLTAAPASAR